MSTVGTAYVQIVPSAQGIKGSIEGVLEPEAESAGKSVGGKLSSALGGAARAGAIALGATAAVGGATIAAGKALFNAADSAASYGDNIDKMSQKMGLSIEAYQEWDAIMQHSGTSIEAMQASMKTLASAAETGNKAFGQLGLTQEDLQDMSQEDLFAETIKALQNVDNETERTYLAGQLLGRGATELGALLNTSAEDTEAMRQRVHELGGVMSEESVKSAAAFKDSLQDMQTAVSGITRGFTAELMPGITTVMNGLTSVFTGGDGSAAITEGIDMIVSTISGKLPEVIGVIGQIGSALIGSLGSNLPAIMSAITDLFGALVSALISAAPQLLAAGAEMIIQLVNGLTQNIPQVLETIGTLLSALWGVVVQYGPQLLAAGVELIVQLGAGILSAIGEVVGPMAQVASEAVNSFIGQVGEFVDAGVQIIKGIVQGIESAASRVWEAIKGIVSGAIGKVTEFLGISSPSKVFSYFGEMIDAGFAKGIEDNVGMVSGAMDSLNDQTRGVQIGVQRAASSGLGIDSGIAGITQGNLGQLASAIVNGLSTQLGGAGSTEAAIYIDGDRAGRALLPSVRYWSKITPEVSMG